MLTFLVILLVILTAIIILTQKCVGFIVADEKKRLAKKTVLYVDVLLIAAMVLGYTIGHGSYGAGIILHIAVMCFMGQIIFNAMALLFVLFRFAKNRLLKAPQDTGRRQFIKGAALLPLGAAGITLYGGLVEKNDTVIRSFDIPVENIPDDINGFSIVQLSDVHLGSFMTLEDLDGLLKKSAELKGDILAITGDLFDDRRKEHGRRIYQRMEIPGLGPG